MNRVRVFVDAHQKVVSAPHTGWNDLFIDYLHYDLYEWSFVYWEIIFLFISILKILTNHNNKDINI
jgi:hypothetical protein